MKIRLCAISHVKELESNKAVLVNAVARKMTIESDIDVMETRGYRRTFWMPIIWSGMVGKCTWKICDGGTASFPQVSLQTNCMIYIIPFSFLTFIWCGMTLCAMPWWDTSLWMHLFCLSTRFHQCKSALTPFYTGHISVCIAMQVCQMS
jgi:uncharacterized membrane protein YhaH (DUF805 family)